MHEYMTSLCNIYEPHPVLKFCFKTRQKHTVDISILGTATCSSKAHLLEVINKRVGILCIHVTTVILMIGSKQITYALQPTTDTHQSQSQQWQVELS